MGKTPRKTMAEVKAEAFLAGFRACQRIMGYHWRKTIRGVTSDEKLFDIYMEMDAHAGLYDDDYKALYMPRHYGPDAFERLRVRVEVLKPHPHAGRKGFILDSDAFRNDAGLHKVWFLSSQPRQARCAFAKDEHLKKLG